MTFFMWWKVLKTLSLDFPSGVHEIIIASHITQTCKSRPINLYSIKEKKRKEKMDNLSFIGIISDALFFSFCEDRKQFIFSTWAHARSVETALSRGSCTSKSITLELHYNYRR